MFMYLSLRRILYLIVTAVPPRGRMLHHAIPDHIQINVYQTTEKMLAFLYRSCMISVFPESSLALFPPVGLLRRFPRDELNTLRDHLPFELYQ